VDLDVRADFPAARARLHAQPPQLLVTALRLREYNGLHLVYLAARAGLRILDTILVSHTELVANPGFESGYTVWTGTAGELEGFDFRPLRHTRGFRLPASGKTGQYSIEDHRREWIGRRRSNPWRAPSTR
jgi:hypothetical protein